MNKENFVSILTVLFYLLLMITLIISLTLITYLDYKDWKDTKTLIREHNGSCIDKGYSVECSYSEEPICTQNGIKIDCANVIK